MFNHKYVRGRAFPAQTVSHDFNMAAVVPVKGEVPMSPREYLEEAFEKEDKNASYQHD